jgi:hypothetical protein
MRVGRRGGPMATSLRRRRRGASSYGLWGQSIVSCTAELLVAAGRGLETRLKDTLNGPMGGIVRAYLPQLWVLRTEQDVTTLGIDKDGTVMVAKGQGMNPDVTIETTHDRLSAALRTGRRESVSTGAFQATAHTAKGQTALSLIRGRLGL